MRKFLLFFLLLFIISVFAAAPLTAADKQPNVSGMFYPSDPAALSAMIDSYLESVQPDYVFNSISGLICPHAGYIYSGLVAACGYKELDVQNRYKTVVILAPSHYQPLADTVAVYGEGGFITPLGRLVVDSDFVQQLMRLDPAVKEMPQAFEREHSVEVQLPFLQKRLTNFKIVPLLLNSPYYDVCEDLSSALANLIKDRDDVLMIASTDMSHYHSRENAYRIDRHTIELIKENDPRKLFELTAKRECELCGAAGVTTLMLTMKKLSVNYITVLKYATSADTANTDPKRVVGYTSVVFSREKPQKSDNKEVKKMLNAEEKNKLLEIARSAITTYVTHKKRLEVHSDDPVLAENRGAFVTIYEGGRLRGCIGRIISDRPLIETVNEMAVAAAAEDPRFSPLSVGELPDIRLEISALSPIKKIEDLNEIEVGKHGLIIRKGFNSGLLLPQVATEYKWDREQFLEHTCLKAGLKPQDYKKGAEIYIFTAEVFGEKK